MEDTSTREEIAGDSGLVNQENVRQVMNMYDEPVHTKNIFPGKRERKQTEGVSGREDAEVAREEEEGDEDYSPEAEAMEPHSGDEEEKLDAVKDVALVRAELVDSPVSARNILTERLRKRLAAVRSMQPDQDLELAQFGDENEEDDPDYVPKEDEDGLSGMAPLVQAQVEMLSKKKRANAKASKEQSDEDHANAKIEILETSPLAKGEEAPLPPKQDEKLSGSKDEPVARPSSAQTPRVPEDLAELKADIGPLIKAQMEKMKKAQKRRSIGELSNGTAGDEEASFMQNQREILRAEAAAKLPSTSSTNSESYSQRVDNEATAKDADLKDDRPKEDRHPVSAEVAPVVESKKEVEGQLRSKPKDKPGLGLTGVLKENSAEGSVPLKSTDESDTAGAESDTAQEEEEELPRLPEYSEPFWCFCAIV